jgi:hypothetical protein
MIRGNEEAMQFLTVFKRRADRFSEADFAALRAQEREQARTLYAQGFTRQIWRVAMAAAPVSSSRPIRKSTCARSSARSHS